MTRAPEIGEGVTVRSPSLGGVSGVASDKATVKQIDADARRARVVFDDDPELLVWVPFAWLSVIN